MTVRLAPSARQQFLDTAGNPYVGAKLFTYLAGTSTKQATYTTSIGDIANTNPVVLDAAGRTPNGLWLTEGADYKFVLAPAFDADPPTSAIYSEDWIRGVNDGADLLSADTGSSLIGHQPTSGAATTVQLELRSHEADLAALEDAGSYSVSVIGEGALPAATGTVNTAAIQAAIDAVAAAGGGDVLFGSGTYLLATRLYWKSNVTLRGTGTTVLKIQDGVDSPVIAIVDQQTTAALTNIGATGITFDGNTAGSPGEVAYSAVILDPIDGGYFERCNFRNARGYGASLQYLATGVPDNTRCQNMTFVQCDFHDNGVGMAVPTDTYDGIDVKNCDGLTFIRCRAYNNARDGFDFRGENVELVSCESYDNGGSGLEVSANSNGYNQESSVRVLGGHYHGNVNGVLIANNPEGGAALTRVSMVGANIRANTSDGVYFIASNANTHASLSDCMMFANGGGGVSILSSAEQIALTNCQAVANTGDGVYCNGAQTLQINGGLLERNGGYGYNEGGSGTRNNLGGALYVAGNTAGGININATSRLTRVAPSVLDYTANGGTAPSDVIASAATITLPEGGDVFFVTGTTNITSITASSRGRAVTLQFFDVLTVTDGAGLLMSGNFVTSSGDTLSLISDGTNWIETSRSPN